MSRSPKLALVAVLAATAAAHAATVTISLNQVARGNTNKYGLLGTFDLTQGGLALDWMKANGKTAAPNVLVGAEKDATSLLSFASPGIGSYQSYADDGYKLTWSGGDPASPAGATGTTADSKTYIGIRGSTNLASNNIGFRTIFTAPSAGDYRLTVYSAATDPTPFDLSATSWVSGALSGSALANKTITTRKNTADVDELTWTVDFIGTTAGEAFAVDLFHVNNTTSSVVAFTGVSLAAIPEPASIGLVMVGAGLLLGGRRRRSR